MSFAFCDFSTVLRNWSYAEMYGISFLIHLADGEIEKLEWNKRISVETASCTVSQHIKRNWRMHTKISHSEL